MAFAYNISSFTMFNFQIPNTLKYIFFFFIDFETLLHQIGWNGIGFGTPLDY
jgi:hypothetical protein